MRLLAHGAERDQRVPHPHQVAVAQPLAAVHALAVDERAVARGAVVDQRPLLADAVEHGVDAGDRRVLRQRDVARLLPADRRALQLRGELEDPLLVLVRAVEQVRRPATVRLEPGLQLGGGRRVQRERQVVQRDASVAGRSADVNRR